MDAVIVLTCGAFFLVQAWRMRTGEDWSTANDRETYEESPTRLSAANHRLSAALTRVVVPIALACLGVAAVLMGIAALF